MGGIRNFTMIYVVYTPPYSNTSNGIRALHRLCHELNKRGCTAFASTKNTNREWEEPYFPVEDIYTHTLRDQIIAIYPESVWDNPWRAKHVVRWVLNYPGRLGGEKFYNPEEIVFVWDQMYNTGVALPNRILNIPMLELDIYYDQKHPRQGTAVYYGKAQVPKSVSFGIEITPDLDKHIVADILNQVQTLLCFDTITAMAQIARLCNTPVMMIPDGIQTPYEEPGVGWNRIPEWNEQMYWDYRLKYGTYWATFERQLDNFINLTSAL